MREATKLPISITPVLALVESQRDLGKQSWYEVVYHDGEDWKSYAGSKTFETLGDIVVVWRYCHEVLP